MNTEEINEIEERERLETQQSMSQLMMDEMIADINSNLANLKDDVEGIMTTMRKPTMDCAEEQPKRKLNMALNARNEVERFNKVKDH